MLEDIILKGSTDRSVTLRCLDSTTGAPKTDVVYNSSGIDLWYRRELSAVVSITEATLAALTTAHADGGFLHISHGYYRLDLPDAAFASGANYVEYGGTVTGGHFVGGKVKLVNINLEDTVRAGLTALPNAAAEASGGLYTRGTGAGQINQANNGQIDANAARTGGTTNTGRDIGASVLLSSGTGTGQVTLTSGRVNADITHIAAAAVSTSTAQLGVNVVNFGGSAGTFASGRPEVNASHAAGTAWNSGAITNATIAADAIGASELAADAVTEIQSGLATSSALSTMQGNVTDILADTADMQPKLGTISNLGGGATIGANLADIEAQTDDIGAAGAGLTALASAANLATMQSDVDAILVDTAEIGVAGAGLTAITVVTDALGDTLEDDGGTYRFTANALEEAPSGGGGSTDWDADERTAIRSILGIPASGTTPDDPSTGILDTIRDSVATRASQSSVDDIPTAAELATALDPLPTAAENATAVWAAGARTLTALDEDSTTLDIDAAVRAAVGLAAADLDTQLGTLPTAAEVADAVHDEALSGHTTPGTAGAALRDTDLRGSRTVIRGTVSSTSPTTTTLTPSALSPAGVDADQFKGRILIFDNDTTSTELRGQATDITASSAATLPLLTFTALSSAPAAGDTFSIV